MTRFPSPDDLPPLVAREPDRRPPHVPTLRHPHRHCKLAHNVHRVLWCGICSVIMSTAPLVVMMSVMFVALVCVVVLIVDQRPGGRARLTALFARQTPGAGEHLVSCPRHARRALWTDVVFALLSVVVVVLQFAALVLDVRISVFTIVALPVGLAIVWAVRQVEHDHAARILPREMR